MDSPALLPSPVAHRGTQRVRGRRTPRAHPDDLPHLRTPTLLTSANSAPSNPPDATYAANSSRSTQAAYAPSNTTEGSSTVSTNNADIYTLHGHVVVVDSRQFSEYTIPEAEDLACRILSAVQRLKDANRELSRERTVAKESGYSNGAASGTSGATAATPSRNAAPQDARKTTGGRRTK